MSVEVQFGSFPHRNMVIKIFSSSFLLGEYCKLKRLSLFTSMQINPLYSSPKSFEQSVEFRIILVVPESFYILNFHRLL